jgi:hypothetical protein
MNMAAKNTKSTGTRTTLQKTQAKAPKRTAKIAAKHEAIRETGKPAAGAAANPLISAGGSEFTDALNAASVAQLEAALQHPGLSNQCRNRIGIALKLRSEPGKAAPTDDIAKTVAAVTKGDLTVGVTVPTAGKKKAKTAKTPKADRKMSGLDAAAKVLAESPEPMNAKAIVEQAAAKGYWASTAKTPWATLYSAMLTDVAKRGTASRFAKVDRGLWTRSGVAAVTSVAKPAAAKAAEVVKITMPGKAATA